MINVLFVGLGGFFGASSRYLVGTWVHRYATEPWFPYGTMTVNLLGCFLIGLLAGMTEARTIIRPEIQLLFGVGFLGGFTTFSSFSYETTVLLAQGRLGAAFFNVGIQLILGLCAVWAGLYLTRGG